MEAVKEAMKRENSGRRRKSSSDDSGRTSMPESPQKGRRDGREEERKPSGLINFSAARARQKTQIAAKAATSRGSELLGMIRLDIVTFDLLDMPPIRYEAFMKTFGKTNSLQASCQSGEDNLEVEVQTEEVTRATAWTQRPPTFGGQQGEDLDPREVRSSLLGVGWEEKKALEHEEVEYVQSSSSLRLATFIQGAGEAILTMLEEEQARQEGSHAESVPQRDIDFADSITVLRVDQTQCLVGLGVSLVEFSPDHPSSLLTVHSSSSSTSCLLCLWNVSQPSRPSHIFSCSSLVTSVCLPTACMVVAGCVEGEMALWDLRETSAAHHQLREEDDEGILKRAPTYVSQGSHASKVPFLLFYLSLLFFFSSRLCQCVTFKMERDHQRLSQTQEVWLISI